MKNTLLKTVSAICLLAGADAALAGSTTSSLGVTASVAANCTINTTAVSFSTYDPVSANASTALTATGAVQIACTKGAAPTVTLGLGSNASGSTRRLIGASSSDLLTYELYQPSGTAPGAACAYTTVWGATGSSIFTPTTATSKAARTYNVCGQISGGQDVTVDTYSDTVVATVNF
ncbi:spore coat protein U domain-containing protein [Burkholderia sp. Ac-20345]|uniref:Csu type fimbrial protein n=1 Tax=Burkholderia sp. Ac-20345 TaxID=2703891 RepID=UPI00197BA4BF|nr:spore coat U domain-containing protein [Burkholderia sp. Ac-20345]MBN3781028.1 spore coat protein U domain-containing protein [Burkholderia sp. Ac-20345]